MGATTYGQRLIFENAKETLREHGVDPNTAVLTQSYLRLEQLCAISVTNILFPVVVNQPSPGATVGAFNTERRLQLQDSFVVSELGVFLWVPSSSTATNSHLYSYPNFFAFAANAPLYQQFYHGYLTLSVNNQVIVPFWDIQRSYKVNQTQGLAAVSATVPDDQLDGRDDAFMPTEPNWYLIGSKNNILTMVLQNALTAVTANSRIVIYLRGVLAQNSTSVQ